MTVLTHVAPLAFRRGQLDALARTLLASPALYTAEMRECLALRTLGRTWAQYREDRGITMGESLIGAENAAERDAFLLLLETALPSRRHELAGAIRRVRTITIRPLAAEAAATAAIVEASAPELDAVRSVLASDKLSSDPVLRLITMVRALRRSADVAADPLGATASSPCWAVNLLGAVDGAPFGLNPLPCPALVARRVFRADVDEDARRDAIVENLLEALHETLCEAVRVQRASSAFGEAITGLRGNSRLYDAWMLLFAFGSMTPAQLARALPCTKAGAAKLLRGLGAHHLAVHHGSGQPFLCRVSFPAAFPLQ
jgi:hypothetical protein